MSACASSHRMAYRQICLESEAGGRRIYVGPGRRGSVLVTQCMSSNALSVLG